MVSNAVVSVVTEGIDYPAKAADFLRLIDRKVEEGTFSPEYVAPVRELFEALDRAKPNATFMEQSTMWTEVGSIQQAIKEMGGPRPVKGEDVIIPKRDNKSPLNLGGIEGDYDTARAVQDIHKEHEGER